MKKIWAMKKKDDAVSPVIATILMVAITVVLAAVLYVMVLGLGSTGSITPAITFNKTTTTDSYVWTVVKVSGDAKVQTTDVYVQLKGNGTSTFIIQTLALGAADGTTGPVGQGGHGFTYSKATTLTTISVGDTFTLSKNYGAGTTCRLVTNGATGEYATLTI